MRKGSKHEVKVEKVVGVSFQRPLKIIYYIPHDPNYSYKYNEPVQVETHYGGDVAWVRYPEVELSSLGLKPETLKIIVKPLTEEELRVFMDRWNKARTYIPVIREKIREHNLPMHVIDAKYTPDFKRFVIFFSAENRVDFRKLLTDLAKIFRMRIELYQIGARDGAAIVGGIGPCGRILCCHSFLRDFKSVSLSMIKEMELDMNPEKLTGLCGRLKCCLAYEWDTYKEALKEFPPLGTIVIYEFNGETYSGKVIQRNVPGGYVVVLSLDGTKKTKVPLKEISQVMTEEEYKQLVAQEPLEEEEEFVALTEDSEEVDEDELEEEGGEEDELE